MLSRTALIILFLAGVFAKEAVEVPRPDFNPTNISAEFIEQFTDDWETRWARSKATKQMDIVDGEEATVFHFDGEWAVEEPTELPTIKGDKGLVLKSVAKHHALVSKFEKPFDNTDNTLVLQYEVKMQNPIECGGAYLKLLTHQKDDKFDPEKFDDKTPYTIMFGPDKCGATNKVHFIFRHKHPKTGQYEEKHLKTTPMARITKETVLYTLIIRPDNTFEILINNEKVSSGSLLEDFDPPVNPAKEIEDPEDKKPEDWVDEERIEDPDAKKPDDWDEDAPYQIPDPNAKKPDDWLDNEPLSIPDPDAEKPEDWDDEEDGEWVAPSINNPKCEEVSGCGEWKAALVANPDYKGPWYPPMIDNPAYKGKWKPRKIPNPNYYNDEHPANFEKMDAIGFELWTMQNNILFDNIYLGHSVEDAKAFAEETWAVKHKIEEEIRKANEPEPSPEDNVDSDESMFQGLITKFRTKFQAFYEHAQVDFLEAITSHPMVVAGLAGLVTVAFLLAFGILSIVASASQPASPKTVKEKVATKSSDNEASTSDQDNGSDENKKKSRNRKKSRKADN